MSLIPIFFDVPHSLVTINAEVLADEIAREPEERRPLDVKKEELQAAFFEGQSQIYREFDERRRDSRNEMRRQKRLDEVYKTFVQQSRELMSEWNKKRANDPLRKPGVYLFEHLGRPIYVGESGCVLNRLSTHLELSHSKPTPLQAYLKGVPLVDVNIHAHVMRWEDISNAARVTSKQWDQLRDEATESMLKQHGLTPDEFAKLPPVQRGNLQREMPLLYETVHKEAELARKTFLRLCERKLMDTHSSEQILLNIVGNTSHKQEFRQSRPKN